jgi:hypothetical protein
LTLSPEAILAQRLHLVCYHGEVPTFTGEGFRPFESQGAPLNPRALARGLAYKFRYSGHSDPAVTVAEHCLLALAVLDTLWPGRPLPLRQAVFLHDASESVLHDLQSTIRPLVFVSTGQGYSDWNAVDTTLTRRIVASLGADPEWLDDAHVHACDLLALCFEKRDCTNLMGDWGLPDIPKEIARLRVEGYTPGQAFLLFDRQMHFLGLC